MRRLVVPKVLAGRKKPAAVAGAAAIITGSLSPWATFPGFPGKMTLSGFPGGARLFSLVLVAGVVLVFFDIPGRRRAGVAAALGAAAVAAVNVIAMANEGEGVTSVAWGAWLTLAGSLLLAAALASLPVDRRAGGGDRRIPAAAGVGALALLMAALLALVVWALAIEEPSRFVSFLVFVGSPVPPFTISASSAG